MPDQNDLLPIYHKLKEHFGHQNWWPAETKDEIVIGAILTQSISWQNVEKALGNLKINHLCSLSEIQKADKDFIAKLIKPTLYFNQKAQKLKDFTNLLFEKYGGNMDALFAVNLPELRSQFLKLKGIGPETADSIILYAAEKPIFVVDAYTKRIFARLGLAHEKWKYNDFQQFFMQNLPHEVELFQDYHAQIVRLGKDYCTKLNPKCKKCPLRKSCEY